MKHRVFTLIELLVVVVIIGVLIIVGMIIDYRTDKYQDLHKKLNKQKEYKYCIASDNSGVSYKAYAIEISDPSITFTINEKNSLE